MSSRTKRARGAKGGKARKTNSPGALSRFRAALARWRDRVRNRLGRQSDDVWGLMLVVAAVLVTLSFFELAGPIGRGISGFLRFLFGVWAYVVPAAFAAVGILLLSAMPRRDHIRLAIAITTVFFGTLSLFHLLTGAISLADNVDRVREHGGAVGALVAFPLRRLIGFWGAFVVLTTLIGAGVLIVTKTTLKEVGITLVSWARSFLRWVRTVRAGRPQPATIMRAEPMPATIAPAAAELTDGTPVKTRPKASTPSSKPGSTKPPKAPPKGTYTLPPLDLLKTGDAGDQNRRSLEQTAGELEEALRQHGVDARLTRIVPGPTVTRYEIELAPGVKVSRVTGLSSDIAYALASPDVRILAPIPGKSAIGIEVPNRSRRLVTLGDILRSDAATENPNPLAVALGMDISGRARMLNLDELPHVLIAGATGAGKSSCINAIVTSLLMRTGPEEVRLILVDPKRVEMGQFSDVPHLLTRVITNPKRASDALQWAVAEMDRRYDLLADAGVRDIMSYREKYDTEQLDPEMFDRFPYLVVIVDELNDLMMVSGRTVEDSIVRIAQMARAVGIHLVLATQRPSVNVITGVIKANVPSRLAFSVASQTDSRVILDTMGAEKLVGLGDMLVITARDPKPERVQGAFVSEAEVHGVVDWIKQQRRAEYEEEQVFAVATEAAADAQEYDGEDPVIVDQAIDLVVRSGLGSTSMLQRKLRIGFARAGRVMDILERRGVVGPSEGSKAREVLMTVDELEGAGQRV